MHLTQANIKKTAEVGKKSDMKQGRTKTFFADGTDVTTDLKKLSLFSSSVSVGIKYQF
jgi:hypothetical protein